MVIDLILLSIFLFIGAMASVFFSCDIPVHFIPFIVTTVFRQPSWRLRSPGIVLSIIFFLCPISPFSDLPLIFFEGRMVLRISCVMYAMGFFFPLTSFLCRCFYVPVRLVLQICLTQFSLSSFSFLSPMFCFSGDIPLVCFGDMYIWFYSDVHR